LRRYADADNHVVDDSDGAGGGEESLAASADEHGPELGNVAGDTLERTLLPDDDAMAAEMHFEHWLRW
jgi:hypothetical protein